MELLYNLERDTPAAEVHVEAIRAIKRRAEEQSNTPPSSIFLEEISQVNDNEVITNLPQRNDIMRTINRIQNQNNF